MDGDISVCIMKEKYVIRTVLVIACCLVVSGKVFAGEIPVQEDPDMGLNKVVRRGEAVSLIMEAFDVKQKNSKFIDLCTLYVHDCFFTFAAQSDFDGIAFEPLKLYPDVNEKIRYYDAINLASMLGLIHGYINEEGTPFKPEVVITRIQALKIIFGASELLPWKEKFELSDEELTPIMENKDSVFKDVDSMHENMWWYHRYLSFGLNNGILLPEESFRPDEPATKAELLDFIESVKLFVEKNQNDPQIES